MVVHSPRSPGSLSLQHWDPFKKTSGPRSLLKKVLWPHDWRVGNFGDLFARDLAEFLFPETRIVSDAEDRRLLIVGSIASSARSRDVLAGVGFRNKEKFSLPLDTYVWALRGPLSLDLMNKSGRRDIEPRFLADPGLLASTVWERKEGAKAEGWIVIPHYRDLARYRKLVGRQKGIELVSPDAEPRSIARRIAQSQGVISSSLHGLIFAHSYGVPAIPLGPPHWETSFKYRDYAASINWRINFASDISEALTWRSKVSPPDVTNVISSISWPTLAFLREKGCAS